MSTPVSASITELSLWRPHEEVCPSPTGCFSCTVLLQCYDWTRSTYTSAKCRALLSPGEPFSVVLPMDREDLTPTAEPVAWPHRLAWCGVPCGLIRVRVGLPVLGVTTPRPFQLLALLPARDLDDTPPFIRLGAEFVYANRASVELLTSPFEGRLVIPFA
jgi:hypothetical protein